MIDPERKFPDLQMFSKISIKQLQMDMKEILKGQNICKKAISL